jgi:hypothetical protein
MGDNIIAKSLNGTSKKMGEVLMLYVEFESAMSVFERSKYNALGIYRHAQTLKQI